MSRLVKEIALNQPDDFVQYIMSDFLSKHGFTLENFKGEQVYRAGGGMVEIPKFLIWGYRNGIFHIEVWTRTVWLPGVYGKETDLDGFYGAVPKSAYKKDIEELIGLLQQPVNAGGPNPGAMPGNPGGNGQQVVYVKGTDMSRYAGSALIFALIGLLFSFFMPVFGIVFGILGITYGKKGKNSSKRGVATAGFVMGIIAIVIAAIVWILNLVVMLG